MGNLNSVYTKTLKDASYEKDFNFTEYLTNYLLLVGVSTFNRFMASHGFNLKYCLYIHREANKVEKINEKVLDSVKNSYIM